MATKAILGFKGTPKEKMLFLENMTKSIRETWEDE
jgi:hypothetical protein